MFLERELPSGARGFVVLVWLCQAFLSVKGHLKVKVNGKKSGKIVMRSSGGCLCNSPLAEGLRPAFCWPPWSHTDRSAAGRCGLFLFSFAGCAEQVKGISSVCWR